MNDTDTARRGPASAAARQHSRRTVLRGAGLGAAGVSAALLFGCGGGDEDAPTSPAPAATTSATSAAASATVEGRRGGVLRTTSANNTWDTFDLDRSRFTPVAEIYGLTNDGIVNWKSYANPELEGGFASSWQQPDETTLVLTLRDQVIWHDKPPVSGRAATAEDMAAFILRNRDATLRDGTLDQVNFSRTSKFQRVDRAEVTDAKTVKVTFSRPDPLFLGALAGGAAKVMAPEAIDAFEPDFAKLDPDHVIGTGGFVLKEWAAEGESTFERFDGAWRETWFDGIRWFPLFTDLAAQQAGFEQRQLDYFAPVNPQVGDDIRRRYSGQLHEARYFSGNPMAGSYAAHSEPWSDPRKIGAIVRAVDRRAILNSLLHGQGALCGNIAPAQPAFAIPERELLTMPGFLEDHSADDREARAMWEAGGGPALGDITIDIPDIWEGLFSGGTALVVDHLRSVLGSEFKPKIEPYTTILTKVNSSSYGNGNNNLWHGWIAALDDPDPTATNYSFYNSSQPNWKLRGFKNAAIDLLTEEAVNEFSLARRAELSKEVDREMLRNYGAGIFTTVIGIIPVLIWNYLHEGELSPFPAAHMRANGWWFDQSDPTWNGRPG